MARWVLEVLATSHTDRSGAAATPSPVTGEFATQPDVAAAARSTHSDPAPTEVAVSARGSD